MYRVLQHICSAYGIFEVGKRYQLAKVPKDVIEDWLTQKNPLIEKLTLSAMTKEDKQDEPLDTINEAPIEEEETKSKKKGKKYSDQE